MHCAVDLDNKANSRVANLDGGLDRARARGEVIELFGHDPGHTVPIAKLAYLLDGADARGLAYVTYDDFAHGTDAAPGLALSFDDNYVDAWVALRPLLQAHHARVTFFVSRYDTFSEDQRASLQLLAADGHAVEAHTVRHLRAPDYVEAHGLAAYLRDEVDPSIDGLRADGYEVTAFAYPFGARTGELDDAIARRVSVLRSVELSYDLVDSPCPR